MENIGKATCGGVTKGPRGFRLIGISIGSFSSIEISQTDVRLFSNEICSLFRLSGVGVISTESRGQEGVSFKEIEGEVGESNSKAVDCGIDVAGWGDEAVGEGSFLDIENWVSGHDELAG